MTSHLLDRVAERTPEMVAEVTDTVRRIEKAGLKGSVAALVAEFDVARGDTNGARDDRASNGELLWVILRDGKAVTAFFRRRSQDCSPTAFRVDRTVKVTRTL